MEKKIYNWSSYVPKNITYNGKWVYNWFSNMIPSELNIDDVIYNSVENYYQAMKTNDLFQQQIIATATPSQSKRLGRKVKLRDDWELIKESVMMKGLEAKFTKNKWRKKLIETGNNPIIEWNNWNDKIWGVSVHDCLGQNKLGYLLMELRNRLKYITIINHELL